jgi:hypothetical protein
MLTIDATTPADIDAVCALAHRVWQATYPTLISQPLLKTACAKCPEETLIYSAIARSVATRQSGMSV